MAVAPLSAVRLDISDEDAHRQITTSLKKAVAIRDRMTDLVRNGELSRPRGWAVSGSLLIDAERILSTLTWCADALDEAVRLLTCGLSHCTL
jgi:hypothetical protein